MKKKRQQSDASFVNEAERMARAFARWRTLRPRDSTPGSSTSR